jgi:flagella basal body P-ring formation protein FlgA
MKAMARSCTAIICMFWAAAAAAQSIIELRPAARIATDAPVVLSDVALLHGSDAIALGGVVIREQPRGGETITVDELRRIIEARQRVNWARISLRGSTCVLSAGMAPRASLAAAPIQTVAAAPPDPAGTVRGIVAGRIAGLAQVAPLDLRLAFASEDDAILNMPAAGRTIEVTPTGLSDRLPLSVRIFEGERIVMHRTIRVGVEVRREVVIAATGRRRGETIAEEDVTIGVQWLGLAARPGRPDQVVGSSPKMRVTPGQVIMSEDVSPPVVVNKGEQVTVYCVRGTVMLTLRARAMGAGRDGELVQLQTLDGQRTFQARMDGRGRAVINTGGEQVAAGALQ